MFDRLKNIKEKYEQISKELTSPEVLNDFSKLKELSKEQSDLKEIVDTYEKYNKVLSDIDEAKQMENDPEFREFAMEELERTGAAL